MAVDFLSALGAGTGIDTKELVESLVQAEKAPLENAINAKKKGAELDISAYGLVKSSLQVLKGAFDGLKDLSDLKDFAVTNGASSAVSVSASSSADAGAHSIQVTQLADRDIWSSAGFASASTSLNSGSDITISISVSGTTSNIVVSSPTPTSIVTAINEADLGVQAQLIDDGSGATPFVISLAGAMGSDNSFSATADSGDVSFSTRLSTAADARLTVNGMSITRSSNSVSDVVPGVTLELSAVMSAVQSFTIQKDTAKAKTAIQNLVNIYNDVNTILKSLDTGGDTGDELGGSLSGDPTFRSIVRDIKGFVTDISSTPSGDLNYFADIGVSFQRDGSLSINESTLDSKLSSSFADVVQLLTAGTEDQTQYGDFNRGLAGDASKAINDLLASTGTIALAISNSQEYVSGYETDLENLESRMTRVYDRYMTQFTAMQSFVDQMNNTRKYLEEQMKALPYNNRD
jgi:flagellar hook-associated protein 2